MVCSRSVRVFLGRLILGIQVPLCPGPWARVGVRMRPGRGLRPWVCAHGRVTGSVCSRADSGPFRRRRAPEDIAAARPGGREAPVPQRADRGAHHKVETGEGAPATLTGGSGASFLSRPPLLFPVNSVKVFSVFTADGLRGSGRFCWPGGVRILVGSTICKASLLFTRSG